MSSDTIVAIATPPGVGGIAVVRLSGPDALAIATKHLTLPTTHYPLPTDHSPLATSHSPLATDHSPLATDHLPLPPRHATYCRFDDLDDGIAVYYPVGYTGEPTVEFSCHGSRYVQQAIVEALTGSGARLAEPGEFTLRAFLHGRLNLSQAEAVADLIDAVTPTQHRLAVSQLRGGYAQKLKELRQQLLDLTALLELELDFSQEDVEFADRRQLRALLSSLHAHLSALIASFHMGNALKHGIPVAIVGRPNVGKSTLLNALLQDDRAIVSDIPGTTRDTIEETFVIDGIAFRFLDTAGLRDTADTVERLGIERSRRAQEEALVVIHLVDNPDDLDAMDLPEDTPEKHHLVVLNKCDLLPRSTHATLRHIPLSAKTGEGLDHLKAALVQTVEGSRHEDVMLTNARHYDALVRVDQALQQVDQGLASGFPADLVAVDLRDALYHLGTVTGEVAGDDILSNIFSRFCVGK